MTVSAPCWPMLLAMALLLAANTASGFVPLGATLFAQRTQRCGTDITELFQHDSRTKGKKTTASATNFLLRDFETFDGEVIDPYKTLKVRRKASVAEIKRAYRNLSRRYHPDAARQRDILPGKCNNMDDVRNEWERIKLSYEILSNRKSRSKFDRHDALQDPGKAMRRAAFDVMGKGITGVGSGLWSMGAFAVEQLAKTIEDVSHDHDDDDDFDEANLTASDIKANRMDNDKDSGMHTKRRVAP